jgi:endonuclease/exonuclease/phosphatase (EEP) superfamily protein YafD
MMEHDKNGRSQTKGSTLTPKIFSIVILVAMTAITGCATHGELAYGQSMVAETDPLACALQIGGRDRAHNDVLNSGDIRLVNWNIQKGGDPEWTTDLATFTDEPNLMIFQEAVYGTDEWDVVASDHHRSFAPGHRTATSVTGVMTLSSAEPLTQCNLLTVEPWLRSPKATVITEYGLTDTDETLLVVNIHAINFTFGNRDFKEQVLQAMFVVNDHPGPVLLSGDFNTWHWRQSRILQDLAESRGFEGLDFDEDHRKRTFGQALDHIYVRGLQVIDSTTASFESSDHNPMSVRLSL